MTGPEKDVLGELSTQIATLTREVHVREDDRKERNEVEQTLRIRQRQSDEERWNRQDHRADHLQEQLDEVAASIKQVTLGIDAINTHVTGERERTETIAQKMIDNCQEVRAQNAHTFSLQARTVISTMLGMVITLAIIYFFGFAHNYDTVQDTYYAAAIVGPALVAAAFLWRKN